MGIFFNVRNSGNSRAPTNECGNSADLNGSASAAAAAASVRSTLCRFHRKFANIAASVSIAALRDFIPGRRAAGLNGKLDWPLSGHCWHRHLQCLGPGKFCSNIPLA